jgi:serine/threonine protein kinase
MKHHEHQPLYAWPANLWALTAESVERNANALIPPSIENHSKDSVVLFHRSEIEIGKQLGKGGFSNVFEIKAFLPNPTCNNETCYTEHQHIIRSFYTENATDESTGQARYVIKHLKPSLMSNPRDFQIAAIDLAVEAHFLSSFRHPNILKLRGLAAGGVDAYRSGLHDGYFLIFDQLEETLDQRLHTWRNKHCDEPLSVMVERMRLEKTQGHRHDYSEPLRYASQVASALVYLHERDVIYRDLKPKNIGIDAHGNVKLFDFGFARLLPHERDDNDTFKMTGRIGTLRYMAPEVAVKAPYNLKADVYSWSVVLWEMLSLENPYQSLPRERFLTLVCQRGKRLKLDHAWPKPVRDLISRSWANPISTRPTIQEVYAELEFIQEETTRKECLVETRKRTTSIVLEFPPAFEIEKQKPVTGTVCTAASTQESSTQESTVPAIQRFEI